MQDLDSAVGRLDNILMSVYVIVAILIIAVALVSSKFYGTSNDFYLSIIGSAADIDNHWRRYSDTWYIVSTLHGLMCFDCVNQV
jgi:hypothetical protein